MTETKRPIKADDLNRIHTLQDPQISPDGKYVAFVKITPDPLNKPTSAISGCCQPTTAMPFN